MIRELDITGTDVLDTLKKACRLLAIGYNVRVVRDGKHVLTLNTQLPEGGDSGVCAYITPGQ